MGAPNGGRRTTIGDEEYFVSNGAWFLPFTGADGIDDTVVPTLTGTFQSRPDGHE
jgi:hypothetical protein